MESLIEEWIAKLAVNAGAALDAKTQAVYRAIWLEGLADLSPSVLRAAFEKTLRECKFWPVKVADIRQHVSHAEENAVNLQAEQKWQQVLAYAQTTSPDYVSRPIKIKEQTRAAINAAGGLCWIRDCPESDLQWVRKRFIETYTSWLTLEKNQHVLPDGPIKNLIAGAAQKLLPEAKP